jgi:hypothetical protein
MDSKPAFTIVCRDLARQMDHGINYLDTLGPRPRLWLCVTTDANYFGHLSSFLIIQS